MNLKENITKKIADKAKIKNKNRWVVNVDSVANMEDCKEFLEGFLESITEELIAIKSRLDILEKLNG